MFLHLSRRIKAGSSSAFTNTTLLGEGGRGRGRGKGGKGRG